MFKKTLTIILAMLFLGGASACDSPAGRKSTAEVIDDAVITSTVKAGLLADSQVSGLGIDVDTNEGVVELRGTVGSEAESRKAEEIARNAEGVISVDNRLVIDSDGAD